MPIDFKVAQTVINRPFKLQIPSGERARIERFYLTLLLEPKTGPEIDAAFLHNDLVIPNYAQALRLTMQSSLFHRPGRYVDTTYQKGVGYHYFTTPAGAQYLTSLPAEGAAQ